MIGTSRRGIVAAGAAGMVGLALSGASMADPLGVQLWTAKVEQEAPFRMPVFEDLGASYRYLHAL